LRTELRTVASTRKAAKGIAAGLKGGELLLLCGSLGCGKTTFMKFLAEALGFPAEEVSSPSFTIVNHYPRSGKGFGIYHVDLYRLGSGSNLEPIGLQAILDSDDLVAVEWPESAREILLNSSRPLVVLRFELIKGRRFLETGDASSI